MDEIVKKLKVVTGLENVRLEHPTDERFGDYSTNIAMVVAKSNKKNPVEVAKEIKNKLDEIIDKTDTVEKIEVAGGGFLNFYLKKEYLVKQAEKINYEIEFRNDLEKYGHGKTVVIDYSAPNIAKPFGIGHLRSTDIGQALYNIYKILGWKCIGDNHLGDWGTQFGKLIVAIKKWGSSTALRIEDMNVQGLEKLYVKFHQEAENDPKLDDEAREWFAKLEKGDPEAREIWQKCVDISIIEFNQVYELLGVKIDFAHGESFYEKMLPTVIADLKKKKVCIKSQGALIVEFENMPPAMIQKTNSTTTYFTRDLATVKYRLKEWLPDLMIYEVGVDQALHFRQLFKTVEMMNWTDQKSMVHVAHGLIRWKGGKFSTRKGDTIHLGEVIDKAREKAKEIANSTQVSKEMTAAEKKEMIEAVAIGAIKFNDLSQDPRKDIIFDWERVMSLQGDSGPYLQYTYARCQSVLNKTKILEQKNIEDLPKKINDEEIALLRGLNKLEEKIVEAAERYSPAVIAEYLLKISRLYNEFYGKHRIIDQPEETFRIFLTKATANTIGLGLGLLGIKTVERM